MMSHNLTKIVCHTTFKFFVTNMFSESLDQYLRNFLHVLHFLGLVSPVKDQKQCGSCAAFATMALVETCFKKQTGVFGDYSEQHLVDCGYNYQGLINGCQGAAPHGYAKFLVDKKPSLSSEKDYPYKSAVGTCPTTYKTFFQGLNNNQGYT